MNFVHAFESEWLKKRHSAAAWLVIIGGFFIPAIILVARSVEFNGLYAASKTAKYWEHLAWQCWQPMSLFLLPLGVILASSLVTQIEFRNNSWKQLHCTPQSFTTIFFTKFLVLMFMMLQFFILFNIGIYLAGALPSLFFRGIAYPQAAIPFRFLLWQSLYFFVDSLPIIALQYLLGICFRNFMVPLGTGIGLYIATLIALSWKHNYIIPYAYSILDFQFRSGNAKPSVNVHYCAILYFVIFTVAGYVLYITKKEKG